MVESQLTFHTKLLLHSTNHITVCILYAVEPPARYSSVSQPGNALNISDVPCVFYVLTVLTAYIDIRCSNRQLDPLSLVYHGLELYKKKRITFIYALRFYFKCNIHKTKSNIEKRLKISYRFVGNI